MFVFPGGNATLKYGIPDRQVPANVVHNMSVIRIYSRLISKMARLPRCCMRAGIL
jgi:hypothetical protein